MILLFLSAWHLVRIKAKSNDTKTVNIHYISKVQTEKYIFRAIDFFSVQTSYIPCAM